MIRRRGRAATGSALRPVNLPDVSCYETVLALPSPRHDDELFVESVVCATDFSAAGLNAFAHALMMAVTLRCRFTLFHAGETKDADVEWSRIPGVRNVLERWGYLEEGSPRSAVFDKMAVDVDKVYVQSRDALGELTHFLKTHPADLVVIGNDGHSNKSSWLHPSATRRITWDSRTMTMFVPASGGFVSMAHGGFTLRRVLVPVNSHPDPQPAITYAFRAAVFSSEDVVAMDLLHVGEKHQSLQLDLPERDYLRWELISSGGNVSDQILGTASQLDCSLIAMTTDGAGGLFGSPRGSITERVVQGAPCPVLAVPGTL
jgi:nucleotide-binding universal stress UspA family protein